MNTYNSLSPEERRIIIDKETERPASGSFYTHDAKGVYTCRQCNAHLYLSEHKFRSSCGWPSFDNEIQEAIKRTLDADGRRIEITCNNCDGHLGHVFEGEYCTPKNIRHCVNSISLGFISQDHLDENLQKKNSKDVKKCYLAGGCFWGLEEFVRKQEGVINTLVGYTGGENRNPTYQNHPGHAEAIEIEYDTKKTSFEKILDLFFRVHNPTTLNRQGNDIGSSYRSAIFYQSEEEKKRAEGFIKKVDASYKWDGKVVTTLESFDIFYCAEGYHQDYLQKNPTGYTCHSLWKSSFL